MRQVKVKAKLLFLLIQGKRGAVLAHTQKKTQQNSKQALLTNASIKNPMRPCWLIGFQQPLGALLSFRRSDLRYGVT